MKWVIVTLMIHTGEPVSIDVHGFLSEAKCQEFAGALNHGKWGKPDIFHYCRKVGEIE